MFMLAEKQQSKAVEPAAPFWIDPQVEVALTAQINEHFPPEGVSDLVNGHPHEPSPALMDCYNRDNPDCLPGLPSSHENGDDAR